VWDTEDGRSSSRCRLVSPLSHCLALRRFRSRIGRSGVRPQLGQAAVLRVLCVSVAALSHPSAGAEARARLASRACGLWVCGGTGECGFPISRCVRGSGWFCLWALDLVKSLRCAVGLAGSFWGIFSQNGALVVLVEVLPGPVCRGLLPLCARLRWFLRESCVCHDLVGGRGVVLFSSAA
ncbi:hypothetical protein Taro_009095, partial [Colocasia esculenta]|nr:hypothetical protein [Colocasia esculenta]